MNRKFPGAILIKLALAAALAGTLTCAPEKEHKVLTFFFDGVPPIGGPEAKKSEAKPKAPSAAAAGQPQPAFTGSVHPPTTDVEKCGACHNREASWALVKPVGELCVMCHANLTRQFPQMHGPAAVGACAACHDGHTSKYPHLLLKPVPQLCFECHDRTPAGGKTWSCLRPSDDAICLNCHNPHGGETRFFPVNRPAEAGSGVKAPAGPAPEGR